MSKWFPCPVCSTKNQRGVPRCSACGADFDDPDVRALMSVEAQAATAAPVGEAGQLESSRFIGFQLDDAIDGSASPRLAIVGGIVLALGFVLPLTGDFRTFSAPWKLLDGGPAVALLFPVAALIIAICVASVRRLTGQMRATILLGLGLAGMATLPLLGPLAGAPVAKVVPIYLLMPLCAAAIAVRMQDVTSMRARYLLAAVSGIAAVAMFIPLGKVGQFLPLELNFYIQRSEEQATSSFIGAFAAAFNRDGSVLFVCVMAFLPLALLAGVCALAWPRPTGIWDTYGKVLRPLAWMVAMWLPAFYALQAFNLTGWEGASMVSTGDHYVKFDDFVKTTLGSRLKLAVLAAGYSLWAAVGAVPLLARLGRPTNVRPASAGPADIPPDDQDRSSN